MKMSCKSQIKVDTGPFIGALHCTWDEAWKDVRLLRYISKDPIFMQVHSTKHWLALVKLNLSGALFNFFPSPTPVWYFGDSLFTEAGGDDNGLLLIPC